MTDTYGAMVIDFFVPALHGIDVNGVQFQQDITYKHTSYATIDLLRQTFDGHLIIRFNTAVI